MDSSKTNFQNAGRHIVGGSRKSNMLDDKRANLYANIANVYKENKDSAELGPQ